MKVCMTLYYNEETAELLKVEESSYFKKASELERVDVLQDITLKLVTQYEKEKESFYRTIFKKSRA